MCFVSKKSAALGNNKVKDGHDFMIRAYQAAHCQMLSLEKALLA